MRLIRALAAAALVAGGGAVSASGQTVTNGTFEADTFPAWPGYLSASTANGTNPAQITGWTSPANNVGINPSTDPVQPCCGASPFAPSGGPVSGQFVFMQGAGASISQQISGFTVGDSYRLTFDDAARGGNTGGLTTTITGETPFVTAPSNAAFTSRTLDFTAEAATLTLTFANSSPAGDNTVDVDNVAITLVPEPASFGLLALGGPALLARRRRTS